MPLRVIAHVPDDGSPSEGAAGESHTNASPRTDVQVEREAKRISDVRRAASAPSSRMLARAAAETKGGQAAIARALSVTATTVSRWLDEEDDAAMTFRDVCAAPKSFRRALGALLIQSADEESPIAPSLTHEQHILALMSELGDVSRADQRDIERLDRELSEVADAANRARRDLRARGGSR